MTRVALLVCVLLGGCGPGAPQDAGPLEPAARQIAVIPKGTTHEFWRSIHAGAVKAERELNEQGFPVRVIWQGPLREDDRDTQIQVVENFTARQVSGIVLAPLDSRSLVRPVSTAVAGGIPVVVIDSGLDGGGYSSFVATDNYAGGARAAHYLSERLDGKGNVILYRYAVGSASTEDRERGFLETLAQDHPGLEIISSTEYAGPTRETAYRTAQALLNRFGDQVDGIFAVNENSTIGMTMALREIGRAGGRVTMIGFDAGSSSIEDLENGDVQALVVQDPLRMGYLGVMTLARVIRGEPVEARIDTGVMLVTQDNMDSDAARRLLYPPLDQYLE